MASKVVKVEEVHGPPGGHRDPKFIPAYDRSRTNQTVSTLLAYGTDSSLLHISRQDDSGLALDIVEVDEEDESKDNLYPLPDNWPKIPAIFRRRSCELTASTAPCVNKAVSHLELLQNVIEDWFKEKDEEGTKSKMESVRSGGSQQSSKKKIFSAFIKKDVTFVDHTRESTSRGLTSASSKRSYISSATQSLSVHGMGYKEDQQAVDESMPYLGAEEAVEEVTTLLARLENDRRETEAALIREKERVVRLGAKIDHHCSRRMTELPAVVQKEHEECIVDLNELQWHVAYSSRNEARIKDRVEIAEVLNKRLKEDIEFVKKHIPLVEEKLELELEAMEKIRNAQCDTNQELDSTKNRQEKTEEKSSQAADKADKERGHIKHELDKVREALSNINEELSEAKMTYNAYNHQINDIRQQLKDNEQELKVLEVKNENAKVAEEMQAAKVRDINNKIVESEFDHQRLEAENLQLQTEFNIKVKQYSNARHELELAIKGRDSRLRKVVQENRTVEIMVQDFMDKITECQQQKVADEKNMARIHKEMLRIQQQMGVTQDEHNRVGALNGNIRDQLIAVQEKTFKMEESLKITADTLNRQVKDEVHQRTVLASRISSDTQDLSKSKVDIREKKNKRGYYDGTEYYDETDNYDDEEQTAATKVADDVVTAVKTVKEKVEKLRSAKMDKDRQKISLARQAEETKKQQSDSEKKFEERISQIQPHHEHLKGDLLNVNKRMDHIEWKADVMNNKIADMDKSQGMMDRLVKNTAIAIEKLDGDAEELQLQIEAAQKIDYDLKNQYNDILARLRDSERDHRKFVEDRNKVQRNLETEKVKCIASNKEHASRYRTLQNHYMVLKDKLMNNFEDRVKLENAIKDTRQLQALQMRMQGVMLEYYKYRGLYNSSELSRMEDMSIHNSHKVITLQESMDAALTNITEFLQTEMSGDVARKMAWEAVKKQEARANKRTSSNMKGSRVNTTVTVAS